MSTYHAMEGNTPPSDVLLLNKEEKNVKERKEKNGACDHPSLRLYMLLVPACAYST